MLKIVLDPLGRLRACIDMMERAVAEGGGTCFLVFEYTTSKSTTKVMAMLQYNLRFEGHNHVKFFFRYEDPPRTYRTVREAGEAMVDAVSTFDGGFGSLCALYVETRVLHHECWGPDEAEHHFRAFGDEFKRELMVVAWAPHRHVEWCLDIEEQRSLMPGLDTAP